MTRRRSPALRAPRTQAEALPLLERYAVIAATVSLLNADRDERLAVINSEIDQAIAPLETEAKDLFAQLKTWWAVEGEAVTGGKLRSVELAGCQIGHRLTPPKLVHKFAKDGDAAIALRATAYGDPLTKVTFSLDKAAIMRRLDEETQAAALAAAAAPGIGHNGGSALNDEAAPAAEQPATLAQLGFSTKQTDEFFVAPVAPIGAAA